MTKFSFRYYSKTSLAVRLSISALLVILLVLLFVFERPISKALYKWDDRQIASTSQVSFIDVGQGDATLLELADGKNMLIDCGPKSAGDELISYLKERQIQTIDYFLITHADADHVGGGVHIFQNFDVLEFYRPMTYSASEEQFLDYPVHDTQIYDEVIQAAQQEQAEIFFTSDALSWGSEGGSYYIRVLYPDQPYSNNNDSSAVIKAQIEGFSFMLTGDADTDVEASLIQKYGSQLHSEVLKVAHHGSNTSTSEDFLAAVSPNYAIISVGENSYGHPTDEVLSRLAVAGATVLTTMDEGSIITLIGEGRMQILGVDGKHIDLAMITVIVAVIILALFGIPDFWKKKVKLKKSKK